MCNCAMAFRRVAKKCSFGQQQKGATLLEVIITIVVVSIALVGLLLSIAHSQRHGADTFIQIRAAELGQAVLDEILARPYADSADCPAERQRYNKIDCYHGMDESPPHDIHGQVMEKYQGFRVTVAVESRAFEGINDTHAKHVAVTITTPPPQQHRFAFSAWRTDF